MNKRKNNDLGKHHLLPNKQAFTRLRYILTVLSMVNWLVTTGIFKPTRLEVTIEKKKTNTEKNNLKRKTWSA